jgi:hypothetical protein
MQKPLLLLFFLSVHQLRAQIPADWASAKGITKHGDTLRSPGKMILLDQTGFPTQIWNYLALGGKDTIAADTHRLAEGIHFHFTRSSDGKDIRLKSTGLVFTMQDAGRFEWKVADTSYELKMALEGSLDIYGTMHYQVRVTALQDLELKEISMHMPLRPDSNYTWKKDTSDARRGRSLTRDTWTNIFITTDSAGWQYSLEGRQWDNAGKGGVTVGIKGRSLLANNYSGMHKMRKGDTLEYDFGFDSLP